MGLNSAMTASKPTLTVAMEQNFDLDKRIFVDELAPKLFTGGNNFLDSNNQELLNKKLDCKTI